VSDAIATLVAERGRQFDPAVVDAFVAGLDDVRAILVRFAEESAEPEESTASAPVVLVTL
jgi:HD-GYP domain-containing protein (c-di-GMP phosphodiesterase class II)